MKQITTLADLTADRRNPRRRGMRAEGLLVASLEEVGAARSIVIDEAGNILAGNGTAQAASEAGIDRVKVVEADGEELVAVMRRGLTDVQKRRLSLLDNRTAELAEWDPIELARMQADEIELGDLWTEGELAGLLSSEEEAPRGPGEQQPPRTEEWELTVTGPPETLSAVKSFLGGMRTKGVRWERSDNS